MKLRRLARLAAFLLTTKPKRAKPYGLFSERITCKYTRERCFLSAKTEEKSSVFNKR